MIRVAVIGLPDLAMVLNSHPQLDVQDFPLGAAVGTTLGKVLRGVKPADVVFVVADDGGEQVSDMLAALEKLPRPTVVLEGLDGKVRGRFPKATAVQAPFSINDVVRAIDASLPGIASGDELVEGAVEVDEPAVVASEQTVLDGPGTPEPAPWESEGMGVLPAAQAPTGTTPMQADPGTPPWATGTAETSPSGAVPADPPPWATGAAVAQSAAAPPVRTNGTHSAPMMDPPSDQPPTVDDTAPAAAGADTPPWAAEPAPATGPEVPPWVAARHSPEPAVAGPAATDMPVENTSTAAAQTPPWAVSEDRHVPAWAAGDQAVTSSPVSADTPPWATSPPPAAEVPPATSTAAGNAAATAASSAPTASTSPAQPHSAPVVAGVETPPWASEPETVVPQESVDLPSAPPAALGAPRTPTPTDPGPPPWQVPALPEPTTVGGAVEDRTDDVAGFLPEADDDAPWAASEPQPSVTDTDAGGSDDLLVEAPWAAAPSAPAVSPHDPSSQVPWAVAPAADDTNHDPEPLVSDGHPQDGGFDVPAGDPPSQPPWMALPVEPADAPQEDEGGSTPPAPGPEAYEQPFNEAAPWEIGAAPLSIEDMMPTGQAASDLPHWASAPPATPAGETAAPALATPQVPEWATSSPGPNSLAPIPVEENPTFAQAPYADQTSTRPGTRLGKVLAVVAAKGGVGKSTMSLWTTEAIGAALREQNRRVALIDGNIGQPDISKMMSLWGQTPDLGHIADGRRFTTQELHEALVDHPGLNASVLFGPKQPIKVSEEAALRALSSAVRLMRREYSWIVIDAPVGTVFDDVYRNFLLHEADLLLVIVNPHKPTLQDTASFLQEISQPVHLGGMAYPTDRAAIVLNRSDPKTGISLADVERWLSDYRVLGEIPRVDSVVSAVNDGIYQAPTAAAPVIAEIVQTLTGVAISVDPEMMKAGDGGGRGKSAGGWSSKLKGLLGRN